ncbi:uncharacterized protein BJ171DRAFT_295805 [Polychytrium aggregatum]|uniref:uncharacterized protein n=1 Tax=Polychytrium aggregatum TaxID=110093 RepID=UPI0022FDC680|nr:uncharacterized protein BJ171DRAFT_295805 [Polychytrium aggregatum]KAI9207355.1 hypothetical protein BJ171DRAFT_295805 [Polychytrium aggregatum]
MKNGRSLGWAGTQLLRWLPPPSSSHRPRAISTSGTQAVIWNPTSKLASHRPMVSGASKHASTVPDGRPLYPLSPAPTPAPAPAPAPAQAVPTASPTPSTRPASSVVSQDLKNLSQEIKRFAQLTKVSAQKPEALKDANKILDVALSDDQQELLDLMKSGQSVYFSGKAGTGKTLVLKKFIEYAQQNGLRVAVTAPTGIAATHVGIARLPPSVHHTTVLISNDQRAGRFCGSIALPESAA